jgi:site-specific DNA recombinase
VNVSGIPAARKRRRKGEVPEAVAGVAGVYLRVSSDAQAEDRKSLASQEKACREACERKGLTVGRVFMDDGQSGGTLDRPAMTELRAAVAAGEVSAVVAFAIDRVSRRQSDLYALLEEFGSHNAGLVSATQEFDTTTPVGRAMLGMLGIFAELQREDIKARTRTALAAKKARGEAIGRTPFGLMREGAGFVKHPDEWPTVGRILTERGDGSSCQRIADGLNADGVPTATAMRGERRGKVTGPGRWHAAAVASLCRNEAVIRVAQGG